MKWCLEENFHSTRLVAQIHGDALHCHENAVNCCPSPVQGLQRHRPHDGRTLSLEQDAMPLTITTSFRLLLQWIPFDAMTNTAQVCQIASCICIYEINIYIYIYIFHVYIYIIYIYIYIYINSINKAQFKIQNLPNRSRDIRTRSMTLSWCGLTSDQSADCLLIWTQISVTHKNVGKF